MIRAGDVWYGTCTFWTDDLSQLGKTSGGIPCCPAGHVGFEIEAPEWWESARQFEADGNPGYVAWLERVKGTHPERWDTTVAAQFARERAEVERELHEHDELQ